MARAEGENKGKMRRDAKIAKVGHCGLRSSLRSLRLREMPSFFGPRPFRVFRG